jgi:hypothetical protein
MVEPQHDREPAFDESSLPPWGECAGQVANKQKAPAFIDRNARALENRAVTLAHDGITRNVRSRSTDSDSVGASDYSGDWKQRCDEQESWQSVGGEEQLSCAERGNIVRPLAGCQDKSQKRRLQHRLRSPLHLLFHGVAYRNG